MVEVKDGYAWSYARNSVKKSRLQKRCAKIESFFFLFLEKRMFVDEKYFIHHYFEARFNFFFLCKVLLDNSKMVSTNGNINSNNW